MRPRGLDGVETAGEVKGPNWQGWSEIGRELSSARHQQINVLFLALITFCCQWLHHIHWLPLNPQKTMFSGKWKYLLLIAVKSIALLFIKVFEVLLLFTYPTWFWKKKVLNRIFKVGKHHWNFLYKVLTWVCKIIFSFNISSGCCNRSHNMKSQPSWKSTDISNMATTKPILTGYIFTFIGKNSQHLVNQILQVFLVTWVCIFLSHQTEDIVFGNYANKVLFIQKYVWNYKNMLYFFFFCLFWLM